MPGLSNFGKTPLVHLGEHKGNIYFAKIEARNPTGSIKDRIAYAMLDNAEKTGELKKGMIIIEPTSGNTGIGLASVGRAKGYKVNIVMPESMSIERRKLIRGFGAELTLTTAAEGMRGAAKKAEEMLAQNPGKYYLPDQFSNYSNPAIHAITTGPEIDIDTEGKVDVIVAGVGSGGTVSGIGHYFKNIKKSSVIMVAVEPAASPVITQTLSGKPIQPGPHKIQGIGAGFVPKTLDLTVIDHVVTVEDEDAITRTKALIREEGILCGISSGAALAGAEKICERFGWENKTIVVIFADTGERYLSTELFE